MRHHPRVAVLVVHVAVVHDPPDRRSDLPLHDRPIPHRNGHHRHWFARQRLCRGGLEDGDLGGGLVALWFVGGYLRMRRDPAGTFSYGLTGSPVERFGLFTIIVLGGVIVGVVEGISEVGELTVRTVATGVIAPTIGFGIRWNYFDGLGRRIPREDVGRLASWFNVHLPLTMGIAAGGAAMVSLVEHAGDPRTPTATAWLLTGSVTVVLASIGIAAEAMPDDRFPPDWLRQLIPTIAFAGAAILVIGAARPTPIVLVITVSMLLAMTWFRMFALCLVLGGVPGVARQAAG